MDCYNAIPTEKLTAMSQSQQDIQCAKEKDSIKALLRSNELNMTRIVEERVKTLKAIHEYGIIAEHEVHER